MTDRRDDPGAIPLGAAVDRYLSRRSTDASDSSIYTWEYRLKLFVEWAHTTGIETAGDIRAFDLDEYYDVRSGDVAPATLEGEMWTIKGFVEYLEQLGAVDDDLAGAVRIPDIDDEDRSDDTRLDEQAALDLLTYYRQHDTQRGSRQHALLELLWHTGARMGGLRALDLRDVNLTEDYLVFRHRPSTDTPLKNKTNGERPVAIPSTVTDVLRTYLGDHRRDVRDDHRRQPLLASDVGRPTPNTIRVWCYNATLPCLHTDCPHGKQRSTCEWTEYHSASQCPSSRSPHQVRTGSITWQLNIGIPPEVVAERVNASLGTIEQHYDKESPRERMERRRRPYITEHMETHDTDTTDDE